MADRTLERVVATIEREYQYRLKGRDVAAETRLDELGFDSLDRISLTVDLEEEFDVVIYSDGEEGWTTVADIVATIEGGGKTELYVPPAAPEAGTVDLLTFSTLLNGNVTETPRQAYETAVDLTKSALEEGVEQTEAIHDALSRFAALSQAGKLKVVT